MSWKTAATVLIVVFVIILLQSILAGPFVQVQNDLNDTGDYSNDYYDGNELITGWISDWFNAGLVGIFGIMTWGVARVLRRELTRGGRF